MGAVSLYGKALHNGPYVHNSKGIALLQLQAEESPPGTPLVR